MRKDCLFRAVCALVLVSRAQAAEFHIAPAVAWASDNNPGTAERPWKTIARGTMLAIAGDTVFLHAGIYAESVSVQHNGAREAPITFRAFGDDEVIMDGAETIPAEKWHPVAGTRNLYVTPFERDPGEVLIDGKTLYPKIDQISKLYPRKYKRGILTDSDKTSYQYNPNNKSLLINLGGDLPAKHVVQAARRTAAIQLGSYSRLSGVRFVHFQGAAVNVSGSDSIVEDCMIQECGGGIVVAGWDTQGVILRRNTVLKAFGNGILLVDRPAHCFVEDNLVAECTLNPAHSEDWLGSIKMNSASDITFSHNVVLDAGNPETDQGHDGSGFWGDINIGRAMYVGNTCANCKEAGLYVEYSMADTRAYYNTYYRNGHGITCRQSQRGVFMRNLVLESRGGGLSVWPGNAPYSTIDEVFAHNLVRECNPDIVLQTEHPNFVDYNVYWPRKDGLLAQGQPDKTGTLTSYRQLNEWIKATGQDAHSKVQDAQPADVGLDTVTFRVSDARDSTQILMMVGNGGWEYDDPSGQSLLPYFWRAGAGDDQEHKWVYPGYCGLKGGVDALAYNGSGGTLALASDPTSGSHQSKLAHGGSRFVKINGQKPQQMCPQGLGFWSPSLPARAGDTFDFSCFVKGQDLNPAGQRALAIFAEFSNATGQHRHKVALTEARGSGLMTGTFDWTRISTTVRVPDDSKRMRIFLGLLPASGSLFFDDVSIKVH